MGHGKIEEDSTYIKRAGTMNASTAHQSVIRVAGYRHSDGRPALYSATGFSSSDPSMNNPNVAMHPTLALPSEDTPALFGTLAAGSADGSVMAARGTSFASAQATRLVAKQLLNGIAAGTSIEQAMTGLATKKEQAERLARKNKKAHRYISNASA